MHHATKHHTYSSKLSVTGVAYGVSMVILAMLKLRLMAGLEWRMLRIYIQERQSLLQADCRKTRTRDQ